MRISDWSSDVCSSDLMAAHHGELQGAARLLAHREADRFGFADRRIMRADDLRPAGDDAGLDEAELAEGGGADGGHQVRDPPRRADARAFLRLCPAAFRFG